MLSPVSRKRIYMILMVFLFLLSAVTAFFEIKERNKSFHRLIEAEVPTFNQIQALSRKLSLITLSVYSYYATANHADFNMTFVTKKNDILNILSELKQKPLKHNTIHTIEKEFNKLISLSKAFELVMNQADIDWNKARLALKKVAVLDRRLYAHSQTYAQNLRKEIARDFTQSIQSLNQIVTVISFTTLLLLVSMLILIQINRERLKAIKKQQLHLYFPIKNPAPVMAMDEKGKVIFANPAAEQWAEKFQLDDPKSLLPNDIGEHLTQNGNVQVWEYDLNVAVLRIRLQWLTEYHRYHIYIDDLTSLKVAEKKLIKLSLTDAITGLPNRLCFNKDITQLSIQTKAFALLNVDDFQKVISIAGQNAIDKVIDRAARLIDSCLLKEEAELYRFEGNLFGIRFQHKACKPTLEAITATFKKPLRAEGLDFYFTVNVGLVLNCENELSADDLLRKAGVALDHSKAYNLDNIQSYEASIEALLQKEQALENDLYNALAKKELQVHFQPKVNAANREIISAEALLRWHRNEKEWISPFFFIPIAEKTGLILAIGEWVLKEACTYAKTWNTEKKKKISVAVNVSSVQFIHGDFVETVKQTLSDTGLEAECLQLEVTESVTLHDIEFVINELNKLKALGIKIALDDFGTGFSSLTYLNALPIDYLKIDQSFIRRILESKQDADITHSIITLAHDLGMEVIAEGVEEEAQLALLQSWNCDQIQGYLIAKPMPFKAFIHVLRAMDSN